MNKERSEWQLHVTRKIYQGYRRGIAGLPIGDEDFPGRVQLTKAANRCLDEHEFAPQEKFFPKLSKSSSDRPESFRLNWSREPSFRELVSAIMDLSLVLVLAIVADLLVFKIVPSRRRVARFVCISAFFAVHTLLIVALIGSPLRPVFRTKDLPREFWLQILTCLWWVLAARELVAMLALPALLRKTKIENKILSDIVAACIYVCSALAILGFVFALPLQGIVATSGVIAIVLGLALQNTLGDVFSGLSLSVEKPYDVGDAILLEGGVEGKVVQINWRSTHLRNSENDV